MKNQFAALASGLAAVTLTVISPAAAENAPVVYDASFENAAHHEARITASFRDLAEGPFVFRMSRASPGRYALHEFAKNVYEVSAVDGGGRALKVEQRDPYSWRVEGHDGAVTVSYTLYADRADGTYSQIDRTHAHLNMPATFVWAEGLEDRAIEISFTVTDRRWTAATQLQPAGGRLRFTAPNLQYLMDSPTELSAFDLRSWKLSDGQTIRLAVHHDGNAEDMDRYAAKAQKIVAEQISVFGEAPAFDHGVYTFIADYLPHVSGDGMEHRNSTIITSTSGLYEADFAQIGTLSHEFFHVWNVERMRPAELEPFDFSRANPTPSLWFAEGFTNYYGDIARARSGVTPVDDYLDDLAKTLTFIINAPGREVGSPQSMSLEAAFVDAARAIDPDNRANMFVSYYPYGEVIALALDLTLRTQFEDVSLDDYMRHLWKLHGVTGKPYTHDDLRKGLADVTGDAGFAAAFFASYIEDGDLPDFAPLLAAAGLKLEADDPEKASLGRVAFEEKGDALLIASNTLTGTPLYEAGLDRGDEILSVGRFTIDSKADYEKAMKRHNPGEEAAIRFTSRGEEFTAKIIFAADQTLKITPYEEAELEITDAQKAFRKSWLKTEIDAGKED